MEVKMHRCVACDSDTENAWIAVAGVYNLNNLFINLTHVQTTTTWEGALIT